MKKILKSIYLTSIVVFIAVLTVGVISYFVSKNTLEKQRSDEISSFVYQKRNLVSERISVYKESLRSGVGLFNATDAVTKDMWKAFINSSSLFRRYPGIQGIGYSYMIPKNRLEEATSNIKKVVDPTFEIKPKGNRELYSAIIYIEPQNERNKSAIGYDMYSEPLRREAMEQARDTGDIYITKSVQLVQESNVDEQRGFLMYAAQYEDDTNPQNLEERRKKIRGYVYAAFRSKDLLSEVFKNEEYENFAYRIYDETSGDINLYESDNYDSTVSTFGVKTTQEIDLNGGIWKIDISYDDNAILSDSLSYRPRNILISGFIAAFMISGIIFLLLKSKSNQLLLEKERGINRAKDSLLSIASHQLRTPATGVKQYVGLVLQGFVGDISTKQTQILEKAYDSNERQLKTINDILYLARLDSGRIVVAKKRVDIAKLLNSVIEDMSSELHLREHSYLLKTPKKVIYADVDEHMIRMVFENLISNSIKYTKNGGELTFTVKSTMTRVFISVKDNGVGLTKEAIDTKLFKEFSRVPNELSKKVTGTGVGLYLSKNLVELHGGDITVKSKIGKGSEFIVELPKSVK